MSGVRGSSGWRWLVGVCVALLGVLGFGAGVAGAEYPRLISYGKFSTGEFPFGVAVDNSGLASAGDVYVAGVALSKVNRYDASGNLLAPPSPFGDGSEFYSGVAVNPTNADVYVVDAAGHELDTYDPSTGALVGTPFPISGCANGAFGSYTWSQIATDAAGNVYLPCAPENAVREYSPTGALLQTIEGTGASALSEPAGVAVDSSSGDVWVADVGDNRVEEFSSTGTPLGEIKVEGVRAVAVDGSGDLLALAKNGTAFCGSYAPPCYHLLEFGSAGHQLADIGAGSIGASGFENFGEFNMLAVNESSGRVYVTDAEHNVVWVYGPPTAPTLESELVAEVGTSEAKLGALVAPGGIPTAYRFEYGTTTAYGQATPSPEGSAGGGLAARTVWASASGLAPGTTYHYRVVASNALGTVVGPDETFTTESAAQAACPNEQLRGGFSASLPDCRAYELVTPATALSSQPGQVKSHEAEPAGSAASDGNRMLYTSHDVLPGADSGGYDYLATRTDRGWVSEGVDPRQSYTGDRCTTDNTGVVGFSPSLSSEAVFVGGEQFAYEHELNTREGGCGAEPVEVVSGEPAGVENVLLRDNATGGYKLVNLTPAGVTPENATFRGGSSDLGHVLFSERAQLTADAPEGAEDLYEWAEGSVRLVTVLPDGTPVAGTLAASWGDRPHVISADGSRVFFTADGNLYVRLDASRTVQVDASQAGGGGGGGQFVEASADGSLVYFTDDASAGLTADTAAGSGANLYRYDLSTGALTDLTPNGAGAEFQLWAASQDGAYLYFVTRASLAGGAVAGEPNLYLWHEGTIELIASGVNNVCPETCGHPVSNDGRFLAFNTAKSLTGYDNVDSTTGRPDNEVYLYDASSNTLACASCDPSGQAPAAGGAVLEGRGYGEPHALSDGGRLFFDTVEALVPRDTNGARDVYEYEGGQLYLITTGTSAGEAALVDASESGDDVFFVTRQQLVAQDTHEELRVIYDARVDGGFPAPNPPPACVTADACRAPASPQPLIYGAPSSQTFSGVGNLTPTSEPTTRRAAKKKKKPACKGARTRRPTCHTKKGAGKRTKVDARSHRGERPNANAKSHRGGK